MRQPLKWALACCVCMLLTAPVCGQQMLFSTTSFDSNAVMQARMRLNSLPDSSYQKKIYRKGQMLLPYRLLVPFIQEPFKKYPLVITLHNSSRIGNDNEKQLEPLARIWLQQEIRETYPAFVVAPQFSERSSNYQIDSAKEVLTSFPSAAAILVLDLVKDLINNHPEIDRRRVYIVGYSMGASTGQHLLNRDPDKFAALVSIAGVPDLSNLKGIAAKPIWLIHGEADDENPYRGSVVLFNLLKQNRRLLFTTFRHFNHNNITTPFLSGDALPAWLFRQKQ